MIRFVTLEFSPFIYGQNQQVAGPGLELIAAVCEKARITCSYDIYPWRRAQELIKTGKADGMMVIGRNPSREEWIDFHRLIFALNTGSSSNRTKPWSSLIFLNCKAIR